MQKKDLGLAILIVVVGAVVYLRNPLFLSPINLGNTANLVGLFGIFAIGQFLEGNIITPRLVGKSIGLHPVWLLFALSAFGTVFGFVGMLVAVPVAAALGVLTRFAASQYLDSRLYKGLSGRDDG